MLTVFAERGDDVTLQNLGCFFDDHDRGTQLAKHSDVPELQEPAEEWHKAKLMVVRGLFGHLQGGYERHLASDGLSFCAKILSFLGENLFFFML